MNVVELSKLAKYVQILKNFTDSKQSAGERMFLMKDPLNMSQKYYTHQHCLLLTYYYTTIKIEPKCFFSLLIISRTISTNPLARLLLIYCWRSIVFLII
jgi:hypothetical protein